MSANGTDSLEAPESSERQASLPGARLALILLLSINLFNYIDRQVLAAVEPNIRHELLPGDPDAKTKTGFLSTAFLLTYMVIAPLFGWLGDRFSRWKLTAVGVVLWSLASGASGVPWPVALANAYFILLLTRCCVGIGEAAYGPVAPTLISDLYPIKIRGKVLAWFYLAIPVGSALGYTLGGQAVNPVSFQVSAASLSSLKDHAIPAPIVARLDSLADRNFATQAAFLDEIKKVLSGEELQQYRTTLEIHFGQPRLGWRWAFYLVVPPGIVLGLWCLFMRDPPRGQADAVPGSRTVHLADYLGLLRIPSYVLNTLGMTAMTFALGALGFWMPDYLKERDARGLGPLDPVTTFGVITTLAGLTATLAGGMLGDRLRPRFPGSYFLVSGIAMLIGFPMVLLVVHSQFPWTWVYIFLAVFFLFFNTGPTNTILANVTHPAIRSSAFALNIFVLHALGDAISPPLIGLIAGRFGPQAGYTKLYGMNAGFIVVSVMILVGGLFWLWGTRYLEEDTRLAPTRLHAPGLPQPPGGE